MNKAYLIEAVADRMKAIDAEQGLSDGTPNSYYKREATTAVELVLDCIAVALVKGERVSVTGFGTFLVKEFEERPARNPQTGETVMVPPRSLPKFIPGAGLKKLVNGKELPKDRLAIHKAPKGSRTAK